MIDNDIGMMAVVSVLALVLILAPVSIDGARSGHVLITAVWEA